MATASGSSWSSSCDSWSSVPGYSDPTTTLSTANLVRDADTAQNADMRRLPIYVRRPAMALLLTCWAAVGQSILDNAVIVKLVKAGVGEETVLGMISQQPGAYSLSADDLIALKKAGATDKIIAAMVVRNGAGSPVAVKEGQQAVVTTPHPLPPPGPQASGYEPSSGQVRVYVSDSQSWEMRGGWSAGRWGGSGYQAGGARPQTAEIIKTFNQRCSDVTVTNNVAKADFAVTLDHEGGKGYLRRRNKIVVFDRSGDAIFSDSTRAPGSSVKDACEAILRSAASRTPNLGTAINRTGGELDATQNASPLQAIDEQSRAVAPATATLKTMELAGASGLIEMAFTSTPQGALVTIYGAAIGRTPFITKLQPGTYQAVFSADGYNSVTESVSVGPGYSNIVSGAFETKH